MYFKFLKLDEDTCECIKVTNIELNDDTEIAALVVFEIDLLFQ